MEFKDQETLLVTVAVTVRTLDRVADVEGRSQLLANMTYSSCFVKDCDFLHCSRTKPD